MRGGLAYDPRSHIEQLNKVFHVLSKAPKAHEAAGKVLSVDRLAAGCLHDQVQVSGDKPF